MALNKQSSLLAGARHVFSTIYNWGGGGGGGGQASGVAYARCRRQCIEARSADQSARSAENFFAFIFQDGLSWHLRALYCTIS